MYLYQCVTWHHYLYNLIIFRRASDVFLIYKTSQKISWKFKIVIISAFFSFSSICIHLLKVQRGNCISGLLVSLCLPVHQSNSSLFGVICSDLTLSNLLSDISYFRQGDNSYSFIIDGKEGLTLIHPLLPLPFEATDDPVYINIQHLERQSAATEVIQSMKR